MSEKTNIQKRRLHGIVDSSPRPVLAGRAKIGEKTSKTKGGKVVEFPTKIDYIKFVDGEQNRIDAVHEILGDKPTEFIAVLHSDNPEDWWWYSYRRWKASGLVCHGDGQIGIVEETGEEISCPCKYAEGDAPECKPSGSLKVIIPNLPSIGVFQIDTRGASSTNNIDYAIKTIGNITGGKYMGIPLRVYIEPFKGKQGISYAWKLDILKTPGQVVLAAAEQTRGHIGRLIPAELLEIDTSRPEPEALPSAGEQSEPDAPEAETASLTDLGKIIRERAEVVGWTAAKRKAEYERLIAAHDGDKQEAGEALLALIEDEITVMEEAAEIFDAPEGDDGS